MSEDCSNPKTLALILHPLLLLGNSRLLASSPYSCVSFIGVYLFGFGLFLVFNLIFHGNLFFFSQLAPLI